MREMFALHLHFNSQNLFFFLIFPVFASFQRIFSYYFLNPQITFQFRRQLEWMNEKVKRSQRSHLKATFMKPSLCDLLLGAVMWVNIKDPVECCKFELSTVTCDTVV